MRGLTSPEQVLREAVERFDRIAIACSFQKEASVVLDFATRIAPERFDVFTLDTGVLFDETHETWAAFERHYGIKIAGVRGDQAATRANTEEISWDTKYGLWKIAPLAGWTEKDVWRHIHERGLPYHPLHDRGYASIGCVPCTQPGEGRDGRWAGSGKLECGLHAA